MIRTYPVIFSVQARRDIKALARLIEHDQGAAVALSYIQRLRACCFSLQTFPKRGHFLDDANGNVRVIGFERRVSIHFRVTDAEVVIARLLYAVRQP
ncbi:hypothetical protein IP70_20675 [alpha proteobacterium AAP38]|nr:hypothetical protein IP70_20675 [alpha proteobacterium AAP38]